MKTAFLFLVSGVMLSFSASAADVAADEIQILNRDTHGGLVKPTIAGTQRIYQNLPSVDIVTTEKPENQDQQGDLLNCEKELKQTERLLYSKKMNIVEIQPCQRILQTYEVLEAADAAPVKKVMVHYRATIYFSSVRL